jgi:uncharacterized protein (TIGR02996 family)
MTEDLSALLRACVAAPADAAPRLILADYLEETGDMTTEQAAALRDGHGNWLIGNRKRAIWAFPDGSPILATFKTGDPRTVCVFPEQRVGIVVGRVPEDVWPSCRRCGRPSDLRWTEAGDFAGWVCSACQGKWLPTSSWQTFLAGETIHPGEAVTVGPDGRLTRATAGNTIIGYVVKPADESGHVTVAIG